MADITISCNFETAKVLKVTLDTFAAYTSSTIPFYITTTEFAICARVGANSLFMGLYMSSDMFTQYDVTEDEIIAIDIGSLRQVLSKVGPDEGISMYYADNRLSIVTSDLSETRKKIYAIGVGEPDNEIKGQPPLRIKLDEISERIPCKLKLAQKGFKGIISDIDLPSVGDNFIELRLLDADIMGFSLHDDNGTRPVSATTEVTAGESSDILSISTDGIVDHMSMYNMNDLKNLQKIVDISTDTTVHFGSANPIFIELTSEGWEYQFLLSNVSIVEE